MAIGPFEALCQSPAAALSFDDVIGINELEAGIDKILSRDFNGLVHDFDITAQERHMAELARRFAAKKWAVSVNTLVERPKDRNGVPVIDADGKYKLRLTPDWKACLDDAARERPAPSMIQAIADFAIGGRKR